jgi:TatD DNase family protein
MLIDTHAHLNFRAFEDDFNEVVERSLAENVWLINVGSKYQTSKKAVEIAEKYKKGIYAAIGLHPIHSEEGFEKEEYKELAKSEKVIAIGEIGLDYYRDYELFKEKQKKVFLEQLELAEELNLPVIFHCRKAHDDLLKTLKNHQVQGVIHCFSGRWSQAKKYLDMGFYLGINGIIYKLDLKGVIEKAPLDRILIETDCPYLVPPQAGAERNEPVFVKYIAQDIAKIKSISFDQVAEITFQNAKNLFRV